MAEITAPEIDEWLRSLSDRETGKRLSAVTRNNFRRVLIVAFNFAKGRAERVSRVRANVWPETAQGTGVELEVKLDDQGKVDAIHARLAMLLGLTE